MAKETIVLEDEGTWPKELYGLVARNAAQIHQELELERRQSMEGKSWLSSIGKSKYIETIEQLGLLLRQYHVKAYHCARVLDAESILRKGLVPLNTETLLANVSDALKSCANADSVLKAEALFHEYAKSTDGNGKRPVLWFYLTEKQTSDYDCQELFEYFGGGVTRSVLRKKRYMYYPLLRRIGSPVVFECRINIADGTDDQVANLAEQMVHYVVNKEIDGFLLPIKVEFSTQQPIYPDDILKVKNITLT